MKIESLGKRVLFLMPSVKVYNPKYSKSGQSIAKKIHAFLVGTFNGYTCASGNIYGYFSSDTLEYDELREFRTSCGFGNQRDRLQKLQKFLAEVCFDIDEECIYLEFGDEVMLIYGEGEQ